MIKVKDDVLLSVTQPITAVIVCIIQKSHIANLCLGGFQAWWCSEFCTKLKQTVEPSAFDGVRQDNFAVYVFERSYVTIC